MRMAADSRSGHPRDDDGDRGRRLLQGIVRQVDTHNRQLEQQRMWAAYEQDRRDDRPRRKRRHDSDYDSDDNRRRHDRKAGRRRGASRSTRAEPSDATDAAQPCLLSSSDLERQRRMHDEERLRGKSAVRPASDSLADRVAAHLATVYPSGKLIPLSGARTVDEVWKNDAFLATHKLAVSGDVPPKPPRVKPPKRRPTL